MEVKDHLLYDNLGKQVPFKQTPNHGGALIPQYLIMHYTAAATASSAINWMLNPASKVSAHLHIDREGNIVQLAKFNSLCWHAGESTWKGLKGLNSYSIGIELQNTGKEPYTDVQLRAAKDATTAISKFYKLKDVLGHSDIAPGRKTDPGPLFPMLEFKKIIDNSTVVKRTTTDLNIRIGPGISYGVVTVLKPHTVVAVLESRGSWDRIRVAGLEGWVNSNYLA